MRDREDDIGDADSNEDEMIHWFLDEDQAEEHVPKVGRPRVNESWSWVISLNQDDLNQNHQFKLMNDLQLNDSLVASL